MYNAARSMPNMKKQKFLLEILCLEVETVTSQVANQ